LSDKDKNKYEAKIHELETKLSKLQEGKLDKTEAMLGVTQENSLLKAANSELVKKDLES
jgi:hypothetical protein